MRSAWGTRVGELVEADRRNGFAEMFRQRLGTRDGSVRKRNGLVSGVDQRLQHRARRAAGADDERVDPVRHSGARSSRLAVKP